jgi:hypothetical protein
LHHYLSFSRARRIHIASSFCRARANCAASRTTTIRDARDATPRHPQVAGLGGTGFSPGRAAPARNNNNNNNNNSSIITSKPPPPPPRDGHRGGDG